jgi:2-dehydro-3-deoxyphosphogluconate aldolase/(4S)-4-hydroxy-2-oxoglutarate aldolase
VRHDDLIALVGRTKIVAILRGDLDGREVEIAGALAAGGVAAVEVSIVSPRYAAAIARLAKELGGQMAIGAGTVLTVEQLHEVADCGASFIVSPNFDPEVVEETRRLDLGSFPGAYTATEVVAAWKAGADAVKIFPSGGVEHLKALKAPLPQIRMVPTGGVTGENAGEFLAAGAWGLGIASELVSTREMQTVTAAELTRRALVFSAAVAGSAHE